MSKKQSRNFHKHNTKDLSRKAEQAASQKARQKARRQKADHQRFFAVPLTPLEA